MLQGIPGLGSHYPPCFTRERSLVRRFHPPRLVAARRRVPRRAAGTGMATSAGLRDRHRVGLRSGAERDSTSAAGTPTSNQGAAGRDERAPLERGRRLAAAVEVDHGARARAVRASRPHGGATARSAGPISAATDSSTIGCTNRSVVPPLSTPARTSSSATRAAVAGSSSRGVPESLTFVHRGDYCP